MLGSTGRAAPGGGSMGTMQRALVYGGLFVVLVLALVAVDFVALVGVRGSPLGHNYYMAVGDSLSFGLQPNFNFTSGFADDLFAFLQNANVTDQENLSCAGETTVTMVQGGCVGRFIHHGFYTGAQLDAAVAFLQSHPREVSLITLEIGANDVLPDFNSGTCTPGSTVDADLQTMDTNIVTILRRLLDALKVPTGQTTGIIHMLNYYNPFARQCPSSAPFVHKLNDHIAADAAQFDVPVIDIYSAFGGDTDMAQNVCEGRKDASGVLHPYTWICSPEHDIHPTTDGYQVMATAIETQLALPGTAPQVPGMFPLQGDLMPREAVQRRTDV
jgi:lysophospholipase L1-like esterase